MQNSRKPYKGTEAYMTYFPENENASKPDTTPVLRADRESKENVKAAEQGRDDYRQRGGRPIIWIKIRYFSYKKF